MDWLSRATNLAKAAYGYYYPPANSELIGPEDNPEKYYIFKNQKLGEGAFGAVYKGGENKENGKQVVVKKLKTNPFFGINPKESYDREVECLKKIKPICEKFDVICFEDAFKFKNFYYIVTPLLEGYITLFEFVKNPKYAITPQMADSIKKKLKNSLKELHDNGIRHNDLHLGNIMIDPQSGISFEGDINVKIIDFGLCTEQKAQNAFDQFVSKGLNILEQHNITEIGNLLVQKAQETRKNVQPLRKLGGTLFTDKMIDDIIVEEYIRTSPKRSSRSPSRSPGSRSPRSRSPSRRKSSRSPGSRSPSRKI